MPAHSSPSPAPSNPSLPGPLQSLYSPNCLSWAKWLIFNSQKDLNKLPFPLPLASSPSNFYSHAYPKFLFKNLFLFSLPQASMYICLSKMA